MRAVSDWRTEEGFEYRESYDLARRVVGAVLEAHCKETTAKK